MKKIKKLIVLIAIALSNFFLYGCQQDNLESYIMGTHYYDLKHSKYINKIEIEWYSGDITIEENDDVEGINVYCLAVGSQHQTVHKVEENTLKIKFCSHKMHLGSVKAKDIKICLPNDFMNLLDFEVEILSGNVYIENIRMNNLEIKTTTAKVELDNIELNCFKLDSVSSKLDLNGKVKELNSNTVSGDIIIHNNICFNGLNINCVSTDVILVIPDNDGFQLTFEKSSGELDTDFDVDFKDGIYLYKEPKRMFNIETVSGKISLLKNN